MKTDQAQDAESTDRIDPAELATQAAEAERTGYHATTATEEHRPIGVVVSGFSRAAAPARAAPRPWWKFWSRDGRP
jgi:hypothetical protein